MNNEFCEYVLSKADDMAANAGFKCSQQYMEFIKARDDLIKALKEFYEAKES
jgi:hypothetical protein